ncbi:MAG: DNA polymerase I [Ignavibacteria bacterium]|nr:DNA polymerase I [Ignavibacteria bacterium]
MTNTPQKLVLIDAMALAYKAYFAFISRPLKTKSGFPTSAVYGFITQLLKILEDINPDYCIVAYDSKEATFRHQAYAEYKANRAEMPEDMVPQIGKIREMMEVLNIPVLIKPGYEADDIVGTMARLGEAAGMEVFMVTPDKDYVQLITESVKLVKPGKSGEELDIVTTSRARDEYGFNPPQMIDYLALIGDSSDNVPGVKGVGPKGAVPLIQQYGSVEAIYDNIEAITPAGLKNKLIAGKESAYLSKQLVTIDCAVPLDYKLEEAKLVIPDMKAVQQMFIDLEFRNPFSRLVTFYDKRDDGSSEMPVIEEEQQQFTADKVEYHTVTTTEEAAVLVEKLLGSDVVVFDTETDSLNKEVLHIAGASFAVKPGEAWFVAINPFLEQVSLFHPDLSDRLPVKEFVRIFKPFFESGRIKKVCQNGKFDIAVMKTIGINVKGFYFDTMIAAYLLDPEQKIGMDDLSEKYLNYRPIPLSSLIGEKKDASKIFEVPLTQLSDYAAEDADITWRLYEHMKELIAAEKLETVAYDVDFPLVPVLEDMEGNGIKLDSASLKVFSSDLQLQLEIISAKICEIAGEQFNINSTQQMQVVLFEKLGLKPTKKTKTGYSTDAAALESLRGEHEIIDAILQYRQISKLKSTYADALPTMIRTSTGRIHSTFNQTVASSGRLSSLDPNLQNIPIRSELGKEIRKAFIPRDNEHIILSADYSQIELRIMAAMSGDANMIEAFKNGVDIHRSTASLVFQVPVAEVTPEMRRRAKEVNFGILYGIGPFGLKSRLGITQAHAKEIIEIYFKTFPDVRAFIDNCVGMARNTGYAVTLTGRRRFLRNINSGNFVVKQFEERVAVNMPIQGTAADMIKLAMIKIHEYLKQKQMKSKMVLQVHDELVFDVYKPELDEVQHVVKEFMENAMTLRVPLVAELGTGENWLDAH